MAIITKTNLSNITSFRIDAEYYKPEDLAIYNRLVYTKSINLLSLANVNGGKRLPKGEPFSETGFPYIRVVDINNWFVTDEKVAFISERIRKIISAYDIKINDILVTIVGNTVGLTGILNKDLGVANFTENCARIRNSKIDEYYLLAFLNSKYGQIQVVREKVGTSQPKLSLDRLRRFKIFIPNDENIKSISDLVKKSSELSILSRNLFDKANYILNEELGLTNILIKKHRTYTTSFSEVTSTRRMNSEYFSPLVKVIIDSPFLKKSKSISNLFQIVRGNTPKEYLEEGIPVIKTKNIRLPEIDRDRISDCVLSTKNLTAIQENDLLLASMGVGSLGRMSFIHLLEKEYIVDGTIRVLRKKNNTPANYEIPTLLFLSSKIGQELIYRGIVGSTGIISLPDEYLKRIPIPDFSSKLCDELSELVKTSMIAKKQSKELLAQAKNRVEQLIEEAATKN